MTKSLQSTLIYCIVKLGKIQQFELSSKNNNINELRKFHNYIKIQLINNAVKSNNASSLLDIAVGRGGDINKWIHSKLKYIVGFDNHSESIFSDTKKGGEFDGAIARFTNIRSTNKRVPFIKFYKLSALDENALSFLNSKDSNKLYDIVSCQFALHYFSKSDDSLKRVLNLVSNKLNKGGLFIGTATNGDIIKNILDNGNVSIPLLTLMTKNDGYLFHIDSTDNKFRKNYFEIQGVSEEYYLMKNKLIQLASECNLEVVNIQSFYEWYAKYSGKLTTYELIISFLNFSFVFKKI